ncbi:MAG: signal peptidase I [Nitriliruptoraceae bacterium]
MAADRNADDRDSQSDERSRPDDGRGHETRPGVSPDDALFTAADAPPADDRPAPVERDVGRAPVRPEPNRSDERRARSSKRDGSFLRELPVLLLVALVLAFLLRTFVVQVFYIPSSSMEETLSVDDRMVVEKITYRLREPERGEVVVFEGDELGAIDPEATVAERVVRGVGQFVGLVPTSARDFVKRVIGLPGDRIVIEDGLVTVNGVQLDEPYVTYDDASDFGPVTVPEGSLFFLGDNRPNSSDSRRSLGFVDEEAVVGRAAAIIWPPDHARLLTRTRHDLTASDSSRPTTSTSDPDAGDG